MSDQETKQNRQDWLAVTQQVREKRALQDKWQALRNELIKMIDQHAGHPPTVSPQTTDNGNSWSKNRVPLSPTAVLSYENVVTTDPISGQRQSKTTFEYMDGSEGQQERGMKITFTETPRSVKASLLPFDENAHCYPEAESAKTDEASIDAAGQTIRELLNPPNSPPHVTA